MKVKFEFGMYGAAHLCLQAEVGDFLPDTVTIHHNGKEYTYELS